MRIWTHEDDYEDEDSSFILMGDGNKCSSCSSGPDYDRSIGPFSKAEAEVVFKALQEYYKTQKENN